ncbi:MAG: VRR-NUC domain-containing protein [Acidobacteriota bacterium]
MDVVNETEATLSRPLPEGYYVDNFEAILDTVEARYSDLLTQDELDFLATFAGLSIGAKRLYVRLLSRKGPLFRRDRLSYREIPQLDEALAELEAAVLSDRGAALEPEELLALLLRGELAAVLAELAPGAVASSARRREMLAALVGRVEPMTLRRAVDQRIDVVRQLGLRHVLVFRLLFFGNSAQDWTEFVLRDIGVQCYESYPLHLEQRRFPSRQSVDDYLLLKQSRGVIETCLARGEVDAGLEIATALLDRIELLDPTVRPRADAVFNHVGRFLERLGEPRTALEFYSAAERPPARERRARILAKLGRVAEALRLCEAIGAEPRDETEVVFARKFAHRLRRMRGEPLRPLPRRRRPLERLKLIKRDVAVELAVLEAFAEAGRTGFFAENWLWKSLFGLAFWETLFTPVAGAFQHPFQLGPLDLHTPEFRAARVVEIERRLEALRANGEPAQELLRTYDDKKPIANHFVSWQDDLKPLLELALSRLTGAHLAWVFDRLSRDLRRYRRGFPDLFVLRQEAPGFELYEVKAPGDQLRPEQTGWIDYLNDGGIPTSILRVDW